MRILDPRVRRPRPSPTTSRRCSRWHEPTPADVPVITIDGPTASGKGTLAAAVAARLGYHLLDSGALYRAAALAAQRDGCRRPTTTPWPWPQRPAALDLRFDGGRILLGGRRRDRRRCATKPSAWLASRVSALPAVREALHGLQLAFRRAPGLVADGRDMGTVVFPDAALKVFLTASAAQRAERRHKQLISKGISASIDRPSRRPRGARRAGQNRAASRL